MLKRADEGQGEAEREAKREAKRTSLPVPPYKSPMMAPGGAGEGDSDLHERIDRAKDEQERDDEVRDEQGDCSISNRLHVSKDRAAS
jgi:hypothetical protein